MLNCYFCTHRNDTLSFIEKKRGESKLFGQKNPNSSIETIRWNWWNCHSNMLLFCKISGKLKREKKILDAIGMYRIMFRYLCDCDGADWMSMSQCLNKSRKKKSRQKHKYKHTDHAVETDYQTYSRERWKKKIFVCFYSCVWRNMK